MRRHGDGYESHAFMYDVYLAAPFFNDKQRNLCQFIESMEGTDLLVYSPRRDGGMLEPDSTIYNRNRIFKSNTAAINASRWILVVIDDFDPGVLWEMGYAHAQGIPTLAYSDVPGRGLNVMLAGSSELGFVNGRPDLNELFYRVGEDLKCAFPRNTWSGEIE